MKRNEFRPCLCFHAAISLFRTFLHCSVGLLSGRPLRILKPLEKGTGTKAIRTAIPYGATAPTARAWQAPHRNRSSAIS